MDKEQARKLVKDVFEHPFEKANFVRFTKELLNSYEEAPFIHRGNLISDDFDGSVSSFERIGKYLDNENQIDILIVNLKKGTTLERARSTQRNFIARYLNGSRGGQQKDAALVAFVSPEPNDWRFSLIKMEYKLEEGKNGKVKVKEEFTPAKRWSFLVGSNENSHTAQSQFLNILEDEKQISLKQLEDAFNIEKVTKEFFEKYRELFLRVYETITEVVKNDEVIQKDFEEKNVNLVDFSKKLLGQIVFLYFLQKKGWFGVKRDEEWGSGSRRFLRDLFDEKMVKYDNFFNDVLEPLFYDALARDRSDIDHWNDHFKCKIPFLNGGLFDPISGYAWEKTDVLLPNDLFSNTVKDKKTSDVGTGILDIFDRYNFTVKEDEPLDKEVAVDPEMLGKVFENLLEVKDRKSKGTYYTPREIVHYMCEQSLINYLATELDGSIPKEDIESLVKFGEYVAENEATHKAKIGANPDYNGKYQQKLPESIGKHAKVIDGKLSNIKVCDPAIGSGAFPVGMMNEIVRARRTLNAYICENGQLSCPRRTNYDFKFECIQNSLYGVDLDPGAVEIAKLRLWLSLIVDEDDIHQIKPLPNLDYKIMQGNSLIEDLVIGDIIIEFNLDDLVKVDRRTKDAKNLFEKETQHKLFKDKSEDIFDELKKLHSVYFEENNKNKKQILKQRIDEKEQLFISAKCDEEIQRLNTVKRNTQDDKKIKFAEQQIDAIQATLKKLQKESLRPFFLWKLHFSEVFQDNGGFDVVIANPPYIDSEGMVKNGQENIRVTIQKTYKWTKGNWDIYIAFFELGFKEMNENGTLTFITPDKWISKPFGYELRKGTIDKIFAILKAGRKIFDNAKVDSIISFFSNRKNEDLKIVNFEDKRFILKRHINKKLLLSPFTFDDLFSDNLDLLSKISATKNKLSDYYKCENACATSDAYKLEPLVMSLKNDQFDQSKNFKIINTGTIGKFYSKWGKREMTYLKHKYLYPVVDRKEFLYKFPNSYGIKSSQPKIIIKGLNLLDGCLDETGTVIPGKTTLMIAGDDLKKLEFLLTIINSSISLFYIKEKYPASSYNQGTSFTKDMIDNLPIPYASENEQKELISISKKIPLIATSDDYQENKDKQAKVRDLERQLDQRIYKLYGLNEDEIKIVETS